jgi:hypothetical protein
MGEQTATTVDQLQGVEYLADNLFSETDTFVIFLIEVIVHLVLGGWIVLMVSVKLDLSSFMDFGCVFEQDFQGIDEPLDSFLTYFIRVVTVIVPLIYQYRYFFVQLVIVLAFHAVRTTLAP